MQQRRELCELRSSLLIIIIEGSQQQASFPSRVIARKRDLCLLAAAQFIDFSHTQLVPRTVNVTCVKNFSS